jgi:hypothetical protein
MRSSGFEVFAALPPDVRKRSALPFPFPNGFGASPQNGHRPNKENGLAGRPEAFRTSAGRAGDFLGKADASRLKRFDVGGVL